jgi:aminoglycoside/choline kinase family phosphotransferase
MTAPPTFPPIDRDKAIAALLARSGFAGAERHILANDASFRRYDRVTKDGKSAVLMDAPPPKENVRPFVSMALYLERLGYSAPRLLAVDLENGLLLLEDLGDDTFSRLLANGHDETELYGLAVDLLADLHARPQAMPPGVPAFDDDRILTEAALLTDWYMPAVLGAELGAGGRAAYLDLWRKLLPLARSVPDTLVLRDFHVDNLMRLDRPDLAACGLLDFQDAVGGPITYDLMSLLEDARRDVDPALAAAMRDRYLARFPDLDREAFAASWAVLAAQRHAKVIGIFTRLWRRDGKPGYLVHIPRVWRLLDAACAHPALAPLAAWLDREIPRDRRIAPVP